ncbi:MAG: hypothetical protein ACRDWN_02650 [Acidimicrobiales bacterium]
MTDLESGRSPDGTAVTGAPPPAAPPPPEADAPPADAERNANGKTEGSRAKPRIGDTRPAPPPAVPPPPKAPVPVSPASAPRPNGTGPKAADNSSVPATRAKGDPDGARDGAAGTGTARAGAATAGAATPTPPRSERGGRTAPPKPD